MGIETKSGNLECQKITLAMEKNSVQWIVSQRRLIKGHWKMGSIGCLKDS